MAGLMKGPDPFYSFDKAEGASIKESSGIELFSDGDLSGDNNQQPSRGGEGPGLLIYFADGSSEFISSASVLSGFDSESQSNWSLSFNVSSSQLVASSASGTSETDRFDSDPQTYYRIPVARTISGDLVVFDISGIYRENIFCAGEEGPIVELLKIG